MKKKVTKKPAPKTKAESPSKDALVFHKLVEPRVLYDNSKSGYTKTMPVIPLLVVEGFKPGDAVEITIRRERK